MGRGRPALRRRETRRARARRRAAYPSPLAIRPQPTLHVLLHFRGATSNRRRRRSTARAVDGASGRGASRRRVQRRPQYDARPGILWRGVRQLALLRSPALTAQWAWLADEPAVDDRGRYGDPGDRIQASRVT